MSIGCQDVCSLGTCGREESTLKLFTLPPDNKVTSKARFQQEAEALFTERILLENQAEMKETRQRSRLLVNKNNWFFFCFFFPKVFQITFVKNLGKKKNLLSNCGSQGRNSVMCPKCWKQFDLQCAQ